MTSQSLKYSISPQLGFHYILLNIKNSLRETPMPQTVANESCHF